MKKTKRKKPRQNAKPSFQALASYRLHQLSTLSERFIGVRYRDKFGLRMMEVGILILVGGVGPLSFKTAYTKTNLEKSNASRLTAQLLDKGLLEKREDPSDQRSFYLALTPAGEKLYQELYSDAAARNKQWISVLSPKQRDIFLECLDMLTQHTRKLLQALGAGRGPGTLQDRTQEVADFEPQHRIILDTAAASRLYALLGAALGKELVS
jgi:DNA-binding MarR family transcriptional regulator